MTQFLSYAIPGLPYGCVFALMAVGLVLTYQTSGVFNLAYGAQAYASALIFYVCVHAGWPNWAAFLAAVVVVAPLLGLVMDRFLYRFIRSAPVLVKLVSALGMLIAIPSVLQLIFGGEERLAPPSLWLPPGSVYFHVAGDAINGTELSTVIVTLAVVLLASLMSHFTQIGLRMRAMAESPRMVQLAGINSELVGVAIWVLSSFLAGLAGVLLAPLVRRPAGTELHRPARGRHRGRRPREPHQPALGLLGRHRPRGRPGAARRLPAERERAVLGPAPGASLRRAHRPSARAARPSRALVPRRPACRLRPARRPRWRRRSAVTAWKAPSASSDGRCSLPSSSRV